MKPLVEGLVLKYLTGFQDSPGDVKPLVEGLVLKSKKRKTIPFNFEAPRGGAGIEMPSTSEDSHATRSPSWRGWY